MKTYVLILSRVFPSTHPRKGEPTYFDHYVENNGLWAKKLLTKYIGDDYVKGACKKHTIRANYELWRKRFEKIERGEACLSIRQWEGKPYRSKTIEIFRLTKEHGIGLQKLLLGDDVDMIGEYSLIEDGWTLFGIKGDTKVYNQQLAKNDGLSLNDWEEWFKGYDTTKPLAVIHFTKFRY